jgi:hypothetical protein
MFDRTRRDGLLLGMVLTAAALAPAGADDVRTPEALATARRDVARKLYDDCVERLKSPPASQKLADTFSDETMEQVVTWSRRVMEAERDMSGKKADRVAAIEAHRKRIKAWEDELAELTKGDFSGVNRRTADLVTFHRLEADYWLARAKAE